MGHDARIGRIDPIHIGINIAAIRLQRRRQRHGGGVGAAPPQRGDAVIRADALKPGHHGNLALPHALDQLIALDALDPRLAVLAIGLHRDLPALPGARVLPQLLQGDGGEAGGDLLAGGNHRVVFPRVEERREGLAIADELVGHPGHGGDDDRHLMALVGLGLHPPRHIPDPVEIGDRGAAEFHHDTRHASLKSWRALW
jgi:2-polyprenyl-6-hydroxyphenyl methylase/3-demethylubiquinone-9 3-methyltransferase